MNPRVDGYIASGCGRCDYYDTPQCKVNPWREELKLLRRIVLDCGLTEEFKWSQPCYTFNKKNVLIVTALKDYPLIGFFKGSLLADPEGILISPGERSQADRRLVFTSVEQILNQEPLIKAYIHQAIEIEKAGLSVEFKKEQDPMPEELTQKLEELPQFKLAFEALTPGRQRGYIIHFSQPKQSKTRLARIEKYIPQILEGKGMHDHYKSQRK